MPAFGPSAAFFSKINLLSFLWKFDFGIGCCIVVGSLIIYPQTSNIVDTITMDGKVSIVLCYIFQETTDLE